MPGPALPVETGLAGLERVNPEQAHLLPLDHQRVAVDHLVGPGRAHARRQRRKQRCRQSHTESGTHHPDLGSGQLF
jgi:hypothetical protein